MDVRTLCLATLTHGAMSGYQIKKHFEDTFSHFFGAGYGSIYPALSDLAAEGLVRGEDVAQDGKPDKRVFHITPEGDARLRGSLAEEAPRHKVRSEFLVLIYFAHLLDGARLAAVLDEREHDIECQLAQIDEVEKCCSGPPGLGLVAGFGRATLETQLDFRRRHRDRFLSAAADADADATSAP